MPFWNQIINNVFLLLCFVTAIWIIVILVHSNSAVVFPRAPAMVSVHRFYPPDRRLIDLAHFSYIINNPVCSHQLVHMLILIHSAPSHLQHRDIIRNTWGGRRKVGRYQIRTVFLLGAVQNGTTQNILEIENARNGDIVQGNFIDSYKNLTYKHVMGLSWACNYCNHSRYLLKMDDDIYVDIHRLLNLLAGQRIKNVFLCYLQKKMPVVRDSNSKWYVSKREYHDDIFEDYCSGWAYLTNPQVAKSLVEISETRPYFWVDDVHITGTLAKAAKIKYRAFNKWYTIDTESLVEWTKDKRKLKWNYIFGPTWGDALLMTMAHRKAVWCNSNNCTCCFSVTAPTPKYVITTEKILGEAKAVFIG